MRPSKALLSIAFALILSLTAAGPAQAYEWTIKDDVLNGLGISSETTSGSGGAFELTVPGLGLTTECTSQSSVGEIFAGGTASASVTFIGCGVGEIEGCAVKSPGESSGTLAATATMKFLTTEIGEAVKYYDELTPKMTVQFSGAECLLDELEFEVNGTTAAKVPPPGEQLTKRPRKFSEAIVEESGVAGLTFGEEPAYVIGEDTEELDGAFEGQQRGMTTIGFNPAPVVFTGTGAGNSKNVTITNNANRKVKLKEIGVSGTYGLSDPNNCIGKQLAPPGGTPNTCVITVICIQVNPGKTFVAWDELNAAGKVVAFGLTKVDMTCTT